MAPTVRAVGAESFAESFGHASSGGLRVFSRISDGADPTLTNDPGDHIITRVIGITKDTFDPTTPINVKTTGSENVLDPTASIPTVTTTIDDCLVLAIVTGGLDPGANATTFFSGWTNANLTGLTERIDDARVIGLGGVVGAATGVKATAGAVGATTVTLAANSYKAYVTIAITPLTDQAFTGNDAGAGGDSSILLPEFTYTQLTTLVVNQAVQAAAVR
jgi:hypothetical protein